MSPFQWSRLGKTRLLLFGFQRPRVGAVRKTLAGTRRRQKPVMSNMYTSYGKDHILIGGKIGSDPRTRGQSGRESDRETSGCKIQT